MKTAKQWMDENDPAWRDECGQKPELTESVIRAIQVDTLRHAAYLVHDMSRGTKSKERAIALDEARDIIAYEINSVANPPNEKS
jgi:1,2-phenylacetyl-CoA epoxidase catalytic subunit